MVKQISPEMMYRLLVQGVQEYAIYMLDPNGVVLNWNGGAERNKGYRADEIIGRNYDLFYSVEDRASGIPRRNLEIAFKAGQLLTEGYRYRKDGTSFWAGVAIDSIYDEEGKFVGYAKITRDLTEQRESARILAHQSRHDPLTGLLNRTGIVEQIEAQMPHAIGGSPLAIHYVDLDRFKPVNDAFGHHVGDVVLREVARRLELVIGSRGCVGRLGGDEFAVLQFGSPSLDAIISLAEDLIRSLGEPFRIEERVVLIGASVGIAYAPLHGCETAALFQHADLALYVAKREGRNCARVYHPSMSERALARSVLEMKLRHAVVAKEFELVYQPIVDARSCERTGFEALLRWRDQTGQDISPADFIPLAEELGLMPDLGAWVLRAACAEAAAWPEFLTIAVNVSVTQLRGEDFCDIVQQILAETGLRPERLELEITETAVLDNWETAQRMLTRLRALGVRIALDDFGTGFSSLAMVKILPLTRIKIDRSFVCEIDGTAKSMAVIRSVVSLCEGYGLSTTAEGVETQEQRSALILGGCSDLQGYLFGRPASAESYLRPDAVPCASA